MIVYQDDSRENIQATVDQGNAAILNIAAFTINSTRVPAHRLDLSAFRGKAFRLYAEGNGDLSTDQNHDHYWLLVEADIPELQLQSVPTGEVDEDDREITKMVEEPLDLNTVELKIYALPEVAE